MPESRLQRAREINQPHVPGRTWSYCPTCRTEHWTTYRIATDDFVGSCGHTITLAQIRQGRAGKPFYLSEAQEADIAEPDADTPWGI